jgi:hypothetical protein
MEPVPSQRVTHLVERIQQCEVWLEDAWRGFGLQKQILNDIDWYTKPGELDLKPLDSFFAEVAKERLSVAGGRWSWKKRSSLAGYKSPYLDWLHSQWASGRWASDTSIYPETRHLLDPRFARLESLSYQSGGRSHLGLDWPGVISRYRELAAEEASARHARDSDTLTRVTKVSVENYVGQHFENQGWKLCIAPTSSGRLLVAELALVETEYAFRLTFSLADKALLDHVECWMSVTVAGTHMSAVNGGPAALISAPIESLLLPASSYYLLHNKERLLLLQAIALIDSVARAMTRDLARS